jgi:hypothetical protein
MASPLVDVDLDALAPRPKTIKLASKIWKLPGDMPMPLYLRIQAFESRVEGGEDETIMLSELHGELLTLFQVHQPTLKALPEIGVLVLLQSIGAIYGGGNPGEPAAPNRATRRQKKRTPSRPATAPRASRATSR